MTILPCLSSSSTLPVRTNPERVRRPMRVALVEVEDELFFVGCRAMSTFVASQAL
jgi:hypothetical protein